MHCVEIVKNSSLVRDVTSDEEKSALKFIYKLYVLTWLSDDVAAKVSSQSARWEIVALRRRLKSDSAALHAPDLARDSWEVHSVCPTRTLPEIRYLLEWYANETKWKREREKIK